MRSEGKINCQYEWPPAVRNKLKIASVYTGLNMSVLSATAVNIVCDVIESLRNAKVKYASIEDLREKIIQILKEHPEQIGILQNSLIDVLRTAAL
jgi:hypothetical protein